MAEIHQLPLFEGREPDTTEVRFTGSVGGFGHAYRIGQRVYFLVEASVVGVNHEEKGKHRDLVRSHELDLDSAESGLPRLRPRSLRDRLMECFVPGLFDEHTLDSVLSVVGDGIEIVTPHREGCEGVWYRSGSKYGSTEDECVVYRCPTWGRRHHCPAEARIPEALLVSLVEAKEGSG